MKYPKGNQYKDHGDGFDGENEYFRPAPQKKREATDLRERKANLDAFEAKHPAIKAWWTDSTFPFAQSMRSAVQGWGDLTERQMASVQKCVIQRQEYVMRMNARISAASKIDVSVIRALFEKRLPVLYLSANDRDFKFSRAASHSANAGAIYVAEGDLYLGKIVGDAFVRSGACTNNDEADVLLACKNPLDNAIKFGKRTGKCSCCGRKLENEESINLGIGPICRGKYLG
jgi:hypothetical protein